jgi:threonine aldolase
MFVSDNVCCVCPEVPNIRDAVAYGGDEVSNDLDRAFSGYSAFPVGNRAAANARALAFATPRFASIDCYQGAHIETTECGTSEAWAGASKLVQLSGEPYRIAGTRAGRRSPGVRGRQQSAPSTVVRLMQGTKSGTVCSLKRVTSICRVAHDNDLLVQKDGARFSNVLMGLGSTPADISLRPGVGILSYGAWTCADGFVIFNRDLSTQQLGGVA